MLIYITFVLSEKLVSKYGELPGDLHVVEVERDSNGLGLSLVGNRDLGIMSVFVAGIQPQSPVAQDARIRVGDELLEVRSFIYSFLSLNFSSYIQCHWYVLLLYFLVFIKSFAILVVGERIIRINAVILECKNSEHSWCWLLVILFCISGYQFTDPQMLLSRRQGFRKAMNWILIFIWR